MDFWSGSLVENMCRYIGQTVTIFTTSGGLSGDGFTGVLLSADCECVRLLCDVGGAPACPVGSSCTNFETPYGIAGGNGCGCGGGYGAGNGYGGFYGGSPLGAVTVIPTCAIACFTHNAI